MKKGYQGPLLIEIKRLQGAPPGTKIKVVMSKVVFSGLLRHSRTSRSVLGYSQSNSRLLGLGVVLPHLPRAKSRGAILVNSDRILSPSCGEVYDFFTRSETLLVNLTNFTMRCEMVAHLTQKLLSRYV